jgi:hypothetical protein
MMLDQLLHAQLMQALLGRGGNPREVFRTIQQIKRNQIFWELNYERK